MSRKKPSLTWVENGGTLLIGTGRDRDKTLDILGEAGAEGQLKGTGGSLGRHGNGIHEKQS